MDIFVFDIEANDLLYGVDRVHIITLFNMRTKELKSYFKADPSLSSQPDGTVGQAVELLCNSATICHNQSGYDYPALKKLFNDTREVAELPILLGRDTVPKLYDTLHASQLLNPEIKSHGLGTWGAKFGMTKPYQEQWEVLDDSMIHRNREDVLINVKLYEHLLKQEMLQYLAPNSMVKAHTLEMNVAQVHADQIMNGVRLDIMKVNTLLNEWDPYISELGESIVMSAPMRCVQTHKGTPVNKPFLKSGKYSAMVTKHFGSENQAEEVNVLDAFSRIDFERLNVDSSDQLKKYMLSIGWKPTEWNYSKKTGNRTSAKLTEDSYESLPGKLGETIATYNILTHRRSILLNRKGKEKGALHLVRDDGRVPADAYTCGTPTSRYRHTGFVCNLPGVEAPWGAAIRSTLCVPEEFWMIGIDLSGIEIRMMCHHCYDLPGGEEFAELVLKGDYHQANAELWNVPRSLSKRGLYMLLYGCAPKTLAITLGQPAGRGDALMNAFWDAYPALKMLKEILEETYAKEGHIIGLDGRIIHIREDRKLLNSLLQTDAAIIFKSWMVACHKWKHYFNIEGELKQLLAYHDEICFESMNESKAVAEARGKYLEQLALQTGEKFNINVPIEAVAQVGKSYDQVH